MRYGWLLNVFAFFLLPTVLATNGTAEGNTYFLDPFTLGVIFFLVGVAFIIIEITTPGFFIGIPGTILVILGLVMMYFPGVLDTVWGPVIFILLVIMVTAGVFWIYRNIAKPEPSTATTSMSNLVGKIGLVTKKVVPEDLSGKVKVDSQVWSATSTIEIDVGTKVRVLKVEGVHLEVEPLEEGRKKKKEV